MPSTFVQRASAYGNTNLDLDRISRLPYVDEAILYEERGAQVVYRAILKKGNTLHHTRELTGYIQNLFGPRLLSSGPTEMVRPDGTKRSVVEVRVSLLGIEK